MNDASLKDTLHAPGAGPGPGAGPRDADEVDPELLALPAPPAGRRLATMAVMALAVVVAFGLTAVLRHDVVYFFSSAAVTEVGEAATLSPGALRSNSYVHVEGTPMASQVVRYRRLLSGETFVVFPLAGQRTVFVHMPEADLAAPRASYSGRLVTFGEMGGRLDGVRTYFAAELGTPVTGESFVLLVDESPRTAWWALLVSLFCVLFVVLDVWLLVRWFRPLPRTSEA